MIQFQSFSGIVTAIYDYDIQGVENEGCNQLMSVSDGVGDMVNFVLSPETYVAYRADVRVGDAITGYYDGNAPTALIYPPQYLALAIAKRYPHQNVKADRFDNEFISSDGQLQLVITPFTKIELKNGQHFMGSPANRNLIVFYGATTGSDPARTTPTKIVVWC